MSVFESDENVARYESWFEKHPAVFKSEVGLLRSMIPAGVGFEVGIGTGLFARELGIRMGNDPSESMLRIAQSRNLITYRCKGNCLPFHDGYFDFVLMVTTICFLDDVAGTLKECFRVIRPGGSIIVGFVDKESIIGKAYQAAGVKSLFYKEAEFYSAREVRSFLKEAGFIVKKVRQTLFGELSGITEGQQHLEGSGKGGFVAVLANR
jgi:ubiquinone/menaquinone biosynthesis C-methylase UbiE